MNDRKLQNYPICGESADFHLGYPSPLESMARDEEKGLSFVLFWTRGRLI
jgi:hypothetical protein